MEHDHLKQVMQRSHKVHRARLRSQRVAAARFWSEVTLSLGLAVAGFIVWLLGRHRSHPRSVWGIPVFTWLLVAASILPTLALVSAIVRGGTYLLEKALCRVFENVQYVLISLRRGLTCAPSSNIFAIAVRRNWVQIGKCFPVAVAGSMFDDQVHCH